MSEMNEAEDRTAAQIEAELEATRVQMTQTVDALVAQLQPAHLIDLAKEDVSRRFADAKVSTMETIDAARLGDRDALRQVALYAGAGAAVLALIVWRIVRK